MKFFNSLPFKVFAVIFLLFLTWFESFVDHNKDFDIFVGASDLIFSGQNCYEVWIRCDIAGVKYYYSPLFAVLMFPFRFMPQVLNNLIWLSLNYLIIYRILILLRTFLPLRKLSPSLNTWFYFFVILCTFRFAVDNIGLGQMTFLMLWGSLESMRLIYKKKHIAGSALLALIINIKILPIALVAYLIYKKEFRATLFTGLFFLLYLFLPIPVLGYEFNNTLWHSWFASLGGTSSNSIFEDSGRPSLSSLIPALFMNSEILFGIKRNLVNLDAHTVNLILNGVRLALLTVLVYLFGKPFQKFSSTKLLFYDLALICLATPLIFPHQGKYAMYYVLPAYAYCFYCLMRLRLIGLNKLYQKILWLVILSFVCFTLTTDGLIGRQLSNLTEYLHFITYGALSLLIALILLKPKTRNWQNKLPGLKIT